MSASVQASIPIEGSDQWYVRRQLLIEVVQWGTVLKKPSARHNISLPYQQLPHP
jgi:hypothetical protein